jgi:release factor glutamine methyltransferase
MRHETYLSDDDSALLRNVVKGHSGGSSLEIGAGNCGTLIELADSFELAVGTDLVRPGKIGWKHHMGDLVITDAATCFRDRSFDLVVFNPPYVPTETIDDVSVDGGRGGIEVALRFLHEASRVVKKDGRILMLLSSIDSIDDVIEECHRMGLEIRKTAEKKLFYETLSVFMACWR